MEHAIFWIKSVFAAAGGLCVYWLGGLDSVLTVLLFVIVLDYASGLIAAWHNRVLNSAAGFRGIAKKIMSLLVVALAYIIERAAGGTFPLREITIMFFVVNEALSILENAGKIGLPIPEKLKEALAQLKGDTHGKDK